MKDRRQGSHFIKFVRKDCCAGADRNGRGGVDPLRNMEMQMAIPHTTVLIVDDEPLIRLGLVLAFEDAGFDIVEASNVLEAVAVLSRQRVDAVVTDIDMPGGLNGLDLVDLVSAVSTARIVVVSGRTLPQGYELPGGAVYAQKPYDAEAIVNRLRCTLRVEGATGVHFGSAR